MRVLILSLLFLLSCSGIQTSPTCEIEQFGVIKFTNITDDFKQVYVYRVVHDGDSYKRVGKPHQRLIEPMTEGSLRVHPGMVLIIVDKIEGKRWGKIFAIELCKVVRIKMNAAVCFRDLEPLIKSRRSIKGGSCLELFL